MSEVDPAAGTTLADAAAGAPPAPPAQVEEPPESLVGKPAPEPTASGQAPQPAKPDDSPAPAPTQIDLAKLQLPEGMAPEDPRLQSFVGMMTDPKLSAQDRAQAALNLYVEAAKDLGNANMKVWTDTNEQWVKEVKADPEIGGDRLEPNLRMVAKAIDTVLGTESAKAFREALTITGAGNNPAIVRGMVKLAKPLVEGGNVAGNPVERGKFDVKSVFFPNSPDMR